MSRPETKDLNRRYADVICQLNSLEASGVTRSASEHKIKEDLLEEQGKIEH